ncbi:hypothetical protein ACFPPD_05565 [Cohnella suwonensis]|uniref:Uncharacterized protein n=1 Tax=Cohnella suwonensis TaxID=696072 RepID=A0ABW0LUE9_9BACL
MTEENKTAEIKLETEVEEIELTDLEEELTSDHMDDVPGGWGGGRKRARTRTA